MTSLGSVAPAAGIEPAGPVLVDGASSANPIGEVVLVPIELELVGVLSALLSEMKNTRPIRTARPAATRSRKERDPLAASLMSFNCTTHRTGQVAGA